MRGFSILFSLVCVFFFAAFGIYWYLENTGGIEILLTNTSGKYVPRVAMFRTDHLVTLGSLSPGQTIRTRIWPQYNGSLMLTYYLPSPWENEDRNPSQDPNGDKIAMMPEEIYLTNQTVGRMELSFDGIALRATKKELRIDPAIPWIGRPQYHSE